MYVKLDYFYFSVLDLEMKATEILVYITLVWGDTWSTANFRKKLIAKIVLLRTIEKKFVGCMLFADRVFKIPVPEN